MTQFNAIWVEEIETETGSRFECQLAQRDIKDLPDGEVLVRVEYSSLNYKDALSASGNKGVTRSYPHTPGIDAAGVVEYSDSDVFEPGDQVIVSGYDLGMNTSGGLAEYIRVPSQWVIPKPKGLSTREAMVHGTAGFTAALSVDTLQQVGIAPQQGPVLVTGATGGVGAIAVWLLANLGFEVHALTGKPEQSEWLHALGATTIIAREQFDQPQKRPMLKPQWAGVVDTVGGEVLSNAIKSTLYGGSVTCCGMVAGTEFTSSIFPFILRGINLLGIDSVELPLNIKIDIWNQLAEPWKFDNFDVLTQELITEIGLEQVPESVDRLLKGAHRGRYLVKVS